MIDKCHAARLKVGMHMLTSLVGKNDPLVTPKPDPGLLKDGETALATDVNERQTELQATSTLGPAVQGDASDITIDNEIIHCGRIEGPKFMQCQRSFAGTSAGAHKAGARIEHLAERDGAIPGRPPLAA